MSTRQTVIRFFRGVRKDAVGHLLEEGDLADVRNLRAETGALEVRAGYALVRRLAVGYVAQWPTALWALEVPGPVDTVGTDRRANSGVMAAVGAYLDSAQLPDPS